MRTTDPEPCPTGPILGDRVTPKTPDSEPTWKPKPDAPGIEIASDGRLRTNLPTPGWPL